MSNPDTLYFMTSTQWLILANLLLLFSLKILCLMLGYGVIRIGANLLREGVRGEFRFQGSLPGVKSDLVSASPGLLFLLLGIWLIAFAMWVKNDGLGYERKTEIDNTTSTGNTEQQADSVSSSATQNTWHPAIPAASQTPTPQKVGKR
ncbi:hypothetical protein ACI2T3_24070 [Ralstonia nicotianae]